MAKITPGRNACFTGKDSKKQSTCRACPKMLLLEVPGYDLHQERRTDTRSGTNNGFSSENRSTVNQVLSFFPTPNPGLLLFLTTCNLELPTDAFLGKRRTIQRSACFTLLIPAAATTNRGFSRIAQGVDRFYSPNRPDLIPYTRYCRMRNCFSITVYVSRVHPSNENQ